MLDLHWAFAVVCNVPQGLKGTTYDEHDGLCLYGPEGLQGLLLESMHHQGNNSAV